MTTTVQAAKRRVITVREVAEVAHARGVRPAALLPDCPTWCTEAHSPLDWERVDGGQSMRIYHKNQLCYDVETALGAHIVAGQFVYSDGESWTEPVTAQFDEPATGDWSAEDLERVGQLLVTAAASMRDLLADAS